MIRKGFAALLLISLMILLCGCSEKKSVTGRYKAVNPPEETGEMVIQELEFNNNEVTMISDSVQQSVKYEIKDGKFTIKTDYGDFSYDYNLKDDGTLVIDGVDYQKQ